VDKINAVGKEIMIENSEIHSEQLLISSLFKRARTIIGR